MHSLCEGIYSYEDVAKKCGVTRNTVYRRIQTLEKNGFIQNITRALFNYDKLGISAISFGIKVPQPDLQNVIAQLTSDNKVKLLLRAYGQHNVIFIVFSDKGEEGKTISRVSEVLERMKIYNPDVSVGFVWKKSNFCPW
ncbi:MAG: helix-turn-helix domain-containing protein [Candidatus Bathyarchaeota archaeon]|nr:helix-turn-helix domain-containing protein [Candidatus Bathyarchaeota archaeon]